MEVRNLKISGIELEKVLVHLEEEQKKTAEKTQKLEVESSYYVNSERTDLLRQIDNERKKMEELVKFEEEQKRLRDIEELEKRKARLSKKAGTMIRNTSMSLNLIPSVSSPSNQKNRTMILPSATEREATGSKGELIKVEKVHSYQVAKTGKVLSFKFIANQICFEDVFKGFLEHTALFNKKSKAVTVKQCFEILAREPIQVEDEAERLRLARYLVEDSNNNEPFLDWNASSEIPVIRSVLRTLLRNYVIVSPEEQEAIRQKIGELIEKHSKLLKASLKQKLKDESGCNREKLEDVFIENEIGISKQQMDVIEIYLFSISNDLEKLPVERLFDFVKFKDQNKLDP